MPRTRTVHDISTGQSVTEDFTQAEEDARDIAEANQPPPPTDSERVAESLENHDHNVITFNGFLELMNRVRALEDTVNSSSQGAQTEGDLKAWFESQLP